MNRADWFEIAVELTTYQHYNIFLSGGKKFESFKKISIVREKVSDAEKRYPRF